MNGGVAVVGGGINGICVAWEFAHAGFQVDLFESRKLMGETSSASSKLLHGGLRYLEYGRLLSVREALLERAWWLDNAPQLTTCLPLLLPLYKGAGRSRIKLSLGLTLYDLLAGSRGLGQHSWLERRTVMDRGVDLKADGLLGAYLFYDGQMQDRELGLWAAERARLAGARMWENSPVRTLSTTGRVEFADGSTHSYTIVINATGAWASRLVEQSGLRTEFGVEGVRGSHIFLEGSMRDGLCLQHPDDGRIFFVLPYQGQIMIGTTEVKQDVNETTVPSDDEVSYLVRGFNRFFNTQVQDNDVVGKFAGLRPLVKSSDDPTRADRESKIEVTGRLINVWGGKWTTSRALARKVFRRARPLLNSI